MLITSASKVAEAVHDAAQLDGDDDCDLSYRKARVVVSFFRTVDHHEVEQDDGVVDDHNCSLHT